MPYLLLLKKWQNLKLSSAANYRWRFKGKGFETRNNTKQAYSATKTICEHLGKSSAASLTADNKGIDHTTHTVEHLIFAASKFGEF